MPNEPSETSALPTGADPPFASVAPLPERDPPATAEAAVPAPEPTPSPAVAQELASLAASVAELRDGMSRLAARADSDAVLMRRKDEIIADLNRELQSAREGFVGAILRPLFEENVRVVMDIEHQLARGAGGQAQDAVALLEVYRQRLLLGLESSGLFAQPPSELDVPVRFDPHRQVIVNTVDVDDPERHKCVARVVMPAFHFDGKLFLHEKVDVYRYRKPERPAPGASAP